MAQRTGRGGGHRRRRPRGGTLPPVARLDETTRSTEPALGPGADAASVCDDYLASVLIARRHVNAVESPTGRSSPGAGSKPEGARHTGAVLSFIAVNRSQ